MSGIAKPRVSRPLRREPSGSAPSGSAPSGSAPAPARVTFANWNEFQVELRRRIDEFLLRSGRPARDSIRAYVKAVVVLTAFALFYCGLVFVAVGWWQGLLLAMCLGAAAAAIGMNIMHDGGHGSFSKRPWVNKLAAMTLDVVGGSSYIWSWKHGIFHHTYANIAGYDSDIDLGKLGRVSPHQPRYWYQRWQHWYLWPMYGVMAIRWHVYDDFRDLVRGRIGSRPFPRPTGRELAILIGGKAAFFALAFGIPACFHPLWVVIVFYGTVAFVLGTLLSVVFQMAHCVEGAAFPSPDKGSGRMTRAWAVHQVETTRDFIRHSRVRAWFLGGLNFQIEHHLFPRISHVNYAAISNLVEDTCKEFGVHYTEHLSLWSGLVSHFRWLRRMGSTNQAG
jgi:linoleoyl-CoA desaturase